MLKSKRRPQHLSKALKAFVDSDANAATILTLLEDTGDLNEPYWQSYHALLNAALAAAGEDIPRVAELMRALEEFDEIETAIRHVGFELGFEYCRRLLSRSLDGATQ